ncbi:MAG: hypothetical protein GX628_03930 [Clostridiales bacterium]|nr:hypothetical protein [Clostridiales bacterium]
MHLSSFMPYIWAAAAVFSVIIEAIVGGSVALLLILSAVFALIAGMLGKSIPVQLAVYLISAAILVTLRFTLLKNWLGHIPSGGDNEGGENDTGNDNDKDKNKNIETPGR